MKAPARYYLCLDGKTLRPTAALAVPRKSGKGARVVKAPVRPGEAPKG